MKRLATYAVGVVLAVSIALPALQASAQSQSGSASPQAGNNMGGGYGMMGRGQGMGPGMMGPGGGMNPGMMGPGYGMQQGWMGRQPGMGPGYGPQGPGYGPGWNDPEWHQDMHQWMQNWRARRGYGDGYQMGPGYHMGPGYGMGSGMMYGPHMRGYGPSYGPQQAPDREVTPDDVRAMLEQRVARNPNLKVGKVESQDGRIVAEVVTKDGSLVNRFEVDPETGRWIPAN